MHFAISNTEHRNLVNSSYNLTTVHLTDQHGLHILTTDSLADAQSFHYKRKLMTTLELPLADKYLRSGDHYKFRFKFISRAGIEYWSEEDEFLIERGLVEFFRAGYDIIYRHPNEDKLALDNLTPEAPLSLRIFNALNENRADTEAELDALNAEVADLDAQLRKIRQKNNRQAERIRALEDATGVGKGTPGDDDDGQTGGISAGE